VDCIACRSVAIVRVGAVVKLTESAHKQLHEKRCWTRTALITVLSLFTSALPLSALLRVYVNSECIGCHQLERIHFQTYTVNALERNRKLVYRSVRV
jgi:hypothetical protein